MNQKQDRRVRRTKKLLLDGLIDLTKEKSIKDISVRELVDKVDINRSTFYLHYSDIYDMIEKIELELIEEFHQILNSKNVDNIFEEDFLSFIEAVFIVIKDNSNICYSLLSPNGDINFTNKIKSIIIERTNKALHSVLPETISESELKYATSFLVSGCVGLLETWLENNTIGEPKEMADTVYKLVHNCTLIYK